MSSDQQQNINSNKGPKACTTCAKAKARCIPRPGEGEKCQRCHRLEKECHSRLPAPPRARKLPKRSKVAELEKRLDELSSQFDPAAAGRHEGGETQGQGRRDACVGAGTGVMDFSHLFPEGEQKSGVGDDGRMGADASPDSDADSGAAAKARDAAAEEHTATGWNPDSATLQPWNSPWPQPGEARMLVRHYMVTHTNIFPFAKVPEDLWTAEVRHQRPFLWKGVMVVACFCDGARQVRLGRELLGEIGKAAIVDGLKSLDLLQGLQLLIAWFGYAMKSTQMTSLLFLARSMCVNLGSSYFEPFPSQSEGMDLDLHRAYAGTYYLNTLVFTTNKRTDAFMNTAHIETCCRALEMAKQHPSDELLVRLVRIQELSQSISMTMAIDPSQPAMQLPLTMVVQSFQEQIDAFRAQLPPHLKQNVNLEAHLSVAEVLLKEIATSDQQCNSTTMPLTDRLQLLWSCVRSLRAFLDVRFAQRDIEVPRFLGLTASDLAYALIVGTKLITLQLPGWNLEHIVAELRLHEVIEQQIEDLASILERRRRGLFRITGCKVPMGGLEQGGSQFHDPFQRLLMLLKSTLDLLKREVEKRRSEGNMMEGDVDVAMGQGVPTELDEEWWQGLVNDTMWESTGTLGYGMQ